MTTTSAQIDLWRSLPSETQRLEFKEAKTGFDNQKLYRYCVALANEGGGHLLLGIEDKAPRKIVGTLAFNNPIAMAEKLFAAVGFRVDIEEVQHSDGRVLVFHIPSRPRGTAYHLDGAYLMRSGEQLVPMSEDQLRKLFNEGKPEWLTEVACGGCSDADVVRLLDTQAFFDLAKIPYPTTQVSVLERIQSEGLIGLGKDGWNIFNFGAILFAKDLNQFGRLGLRAPRVIVYQGLGKIETRLDQIESKGYAVGFESLVNYVHSLAPSNEWITDALRKATHMFPKIVIRELLGNAIVHQDFEELGSSVRVELYDDRLEISNPGLPLISTERFIDEYKSRNEVMADLLRRLGIFEGKSSGIDKVVNAVEMFQLPAPDFRVGSVNTTAVVFGHRNFDEMDRDDRIRACYQHCCLKYVMNQRMTNQSLRDRFLLTDKQSETASRILRDTLETGKIKLADPAVSSTRYRSYVPFWG